MKPVISKRSHVARTRIRSACWGRMSSRASSIIRAVLPWASGARVVVEGHGPPREMARRHQGGVFEARLPDVHERALAIAST